MKEEAGACSVKERERERECHQFATNEDGKGYLKVVKWVWG